jgi:carboxypeptidase Taq
MLADSSLFSAYSNCWGSDLDKTIAQPARVQGSTEATKARTMNQRAAYEQLIELTRRRAVLASCLELLSWDELTYMPRAGVAHRAEQLALLTGLHHVQLTDPRIGELIGELEGSDLVRDPLSAEAVNVREIRRSVNRQRRLPQRLVEELARTTCRAQSEWEAARRDNDFSRFQPWLERIVGLKSEEAEALGYETSRYDALLEEYEPGARSADIAWLFASLRPELISLLNAIGEKPRKPAGLRGQFPVRQQQLLCEAVAAAVGFDFQSGRLDAAVHPFTSFIGSGDCRLTIRYNLACFCDALFTTLHEAGHGLYEQGLDTAHYGTPMGEVPSLGLHESQARLWENFVGRSRSFWEHFLLQARALFPGTLDAVTLDEVYVAVNQVEASPIRVTADEVTYNLHILVRFDLERALMTGDLKATDVPAAWNEAYRRNLGVTPASDAVGCLQDGHWASGQIGYFPTYTLGNLFAAQLFVRAETDLGSLAGPFAQGRFDGLLGWLRRKVHCEGSRYPSAQLIEHVTGSAPSHHAFVQKLRQKYAELYGL